MHIRLVFATVAAGIFIVASGCDSSSSDSRQAISWIEEGIQHEKMTMSLGYRPYSPETGQAIEPVASITQNGEPVAGAMVFCRLVSTDGAESFGEEIATAYESAHEKEPAHYGQGKLDLPKQSSPCAIRFRIVVPHVDEEWTRDINVRR